MRRLLAAALLAAACGSRAPSPARAGATPDENTAYETIAGPVTRRLLDPQATPLASFDFESEPRGWTLDGATTDPGERHAGARSLRLAAQSSATSAAPVDSVRGKRVRVRAWVKTREVKEWAGLWVRARGRRQQLLLDDARRLGLRGTTDWTLVEVTLVVPHQAESVSYGVELTGKGTAWIDDLALSTDSARPEEMDALK